MRRVSFALLFAVLTAALITTTAVSQPPPGGDKKGPPGKGKDKREVRERPEEFKVDLKEPPASLVKNPRFTEAGSTAKLLAHYELEGSATWGRCGTIGEYTDTGIAFKSNKESGSVSQKVNGFPTGAGKWYRFAFRGLAEPGFAVKSGGLAMRVDYFGAKGTNPLDGVTRELDALVDRDRKELAENGVRKINGGAVWKTYALDFRLPFAEIDTLKLTVNFKNGIAKTDAGSEFYVSDFSLVAIPTPEDAPKIVKTERGPAPNIKSLIHLGGRWYYDSETSSKERPDKLIVNAKNADRLYYMDGRLTNPFAENMTAWMRPGYLDSKGTTLTQDRFVPDNVVLEFRDSKEITVYCRNIPNHPTAKFPERMGGLRNPNSIQELDTRYYLPIDPQKNSKAVAMDKTNSNRALNMGPIGFAINGVSFFNPFDMEGTEAVNIMDRCCGHPGPDNRYHYHKYPVCVKSPFVDEGNEHSPLIGFALDGFPIYGPYVAKGLMAKDDKSNPLDAFNMRNDDERGWHYHVTPGRYPYVIGGYAGTPDPRNLRKGPR